MKSRIYTVGHSRHEINYFIELLKVWSVNCVVDVRSIAASRFNPQFNKKALEASLKQQGITYLHMADEFGARQTSPEILTGGQVDFNKVRKAAKFQNGIHRLKDGVKKGFTITLMCAEADPLECHRFSMITPALKENDFEIIHILKDKTVVPNHALEEQLMTRYKKTFLTSGLFVTTYEERLKAAYDLHGKESAWSVEKP
jgi:uncharacterized protein (DUF488 family)